MAISVLAMQFIITYIKLFRRERIIQFRLSYSKYVHAEIIHYRWNFTEFMSDTIDIIMTDNQIFRVL